VTVCHPRTTAGTVGLVLTRDAITVGQRTKTPEGYLRVPAVFARTGIHLYRAGQIGLTDRPATDVVKVYRSPEQVFAADAMASFGLKPVTNNHPGAGLIDAATAGQFSVGMSLDDVHQDGDLLCGTLVITDGKAVSAIEGGKVQLSGGYEAKYDHTPGTTPGGEQYDAMQLEITGNHIALVDKGRCGPVCSVADSGACGDCDKCPNKPGKGGTVKVKIKNVDHEMDETAGQAVAVLVTDIASLEQRVSDAEGKMSEAEQKAKDAEEEKAKAEGERDAALEQVADTAALDARVDARANLVSIARRLFPEVVTDAQTDHKVRCSVVNKLIGLDVAEKPPAYVEARFDALAEGGGESLRYAKRNLPTKDSGDPNEDKAVAARAKAITDTEDAWKTAAAG